MTGELLGLRATDSGSTRSPSRWTRFCALALLCWLAPSLPAIAQAPQANSPCTVQQVDVGVAGWSMVGRLAPLRVLATGTPGEQWTLEVEALDVDGAPATFASSPQTVPQSGRAELQVQFNLGRLQAPLEARIVSGTGAVAWRARLVPSDAEGTRFHRQLRQEDHLWLSLARLPASLSTSNDRDSRGEQPPRLVVAERQSVADLPTTVAGYDPASVVVLPTRIAGAAADAPSVFQQLSPAQSAALADWVRQGGQLILSVTEAEAYRDGRLAAWLPLEFVGELTLQQFSSLESYAGKGIALRAVGRRRVPRLKSLPSSQAPVRELGGAPIVALYPLGFGRVSVVLIDLEQPPLSDWAGLPLVLRRLTGLVDRLSERPANLGSGRRLSQVGVRDLATQWHQTQEDFPEIRRPGTWSVLLLILLVVLCIGPLDYFLLHRVLKRPEWTWITFPLLVAGFSLLGARWAGWTNGQEVRLNQTDLVDISAADGVVRGRTWVSLYGASHERFAVAVQPQPPLGKGAANAAARPPAEGATAAETAGANQAEASGSRAAQLTWVGSPENALGGVYREPGLNLGGRPYRVVDDGAEILNLPVGQWSTRSLVGRWDARVTAPVVVSRLQTSGLNQVQGTLSHTLPGTLRECLLVVGNWAYAPKNDDRSLAPGVPWQPAGAGSRQRELRALLTGERRERFKREGQLEGDIITSTAAYDPQQRDPMEILKMLTFHEAAGGIEYTGLFHAGLGELELTAQTQVGLGVLIGRLDLPASSVELNGVARPATRQTTLVRLVIPIEQIERASPNQLPKLK